MGNEKSNFIDTAQKLAKKYYGADKDNFDNKVQHEIESTCKELKIYSRAKEKQDK